MRLCCKRHGRCTTKLTGAQTQQDCVRPDVQLNGFVCTSGRRCQVRGESGRYSHEHVVSGSDARRSQCFPAARPDVQHTEAEAASEEDDASSSSSSSTASADADGA